MTSTSANDFQTDWGFPSDVRDSIPGSMYYTIRKTPDAFFRSGRAKYECCFTDSNNSVIQRRDAMELVSKRTGKPYHVVRRHAAASPSPAGQAAREQLARNHAAHQQWSLDDVGLP